jgi:hypothetical protein
MKTFILRGAPINRLLDSELKTLQEAGIEVAITNNNDKFGIDNKTDMWPINTNSIVFMWPECEWVDEKDPLGVIVCNVIKDIFAYRADVNWENKWKHVSGHLQHMNAHYTMIYNLNTFRFGE